MDIIVYSSSASFCKHLGKVTELSVDFCPALPTEVLSTDSILVFHLSLNGYTLDEITRLVKGKGVRFAVCSDQPNVSEMLEVVETGANAYFNVFMQSDNYLQMMRLIKAGQSWFPPDLLAQTFKLARQSVLGKDTTDLLSSLTKREKEIAIAVAEGLSNREIAEKHTISERTVKTHLTSIFVKLEIKDRVALILCLK